MCTSTHDTPRFRPLRVTGVPKASWPETNRPQVPPRGNQTVSARDMTPRGHPAALFMLLRQGKGQEAWRCRSRRNTDQRDPAGGDTHGGDGRLLPIPGRGVCDIRPQKDDGLLEHRRPVRGCGSVRGQGSGTLPGPLRVLAPALLCVLRVLWPCL